MPGSNFIEPSPFLLVFLLGYCLAMIEGELRCYCNESGCVATGYMCKSSASKCFTAVEIREEVTHLTHGCLENLSKEHQRSCRVSVDVVSASKADWTARHLPLLLCCTEHMCNYREDIDVSVILTPKHNGTFHRGRVPANQNSAIYSRNHRSSRDEDRDLWFKAAVIAVPIAGGVILVLLVLLAVRMLRSDSRHHRRLIQIRQERSLTKAHMYISEHFSNKDAKQHCTLFNDKTNRSCMPLFSDKTVTNSSAGNHSTGIPWGLSYFSDTSNNYCDTSNNYCSNSLLNENTPNSDTAHPQGINTNSTGHVSLSRSSNYSNSSHVTCSTTGDVCSHPTAHVKPCSIYSDSPAQNTNFTRDTIVKLNKNSQNVPHTTKLAYNVTFPGPGHLTVSTRETTFQSGPANV